MKDLPDAPPAAAKTARQPPAPSTPEVRPRRGTILPENFAGWTGKAAETFGPYNAATLAGGDAPILVEYGYAGAERRKFTKRGQVLSVEALRLKDASGSYGLFTYYRGQDWTTQETGREQLAWHGGDFLLRKQEVLVRASVQGGSPGAQLSVADLRELADGLETSGGGPLPTLPLYFPPGGSAPQESQIHPRASGLCSLGAQRTARAGGLRDGR